jgi:protocatechuate 3,4-dioxygenase beta subunit
MTRLTRRRFSRRLGIAATTAAVLGTQPAWAGITTPAQVEGPFYPILEQADIDLDLTQLSGHDNVATGEVIFVAGQVFDREGRPMADALVDVWQANHHGRYSHPADSNTAPLDPDFQGWGIVRTDAAGAYRIKTVKPGPYPLSFLGSDGWRCRHIHFKVSHPATNSLTTQMYFENDPLIEQDLEIAKVPTGQRPLLIARSEAEPASGLPLYRFDVVLA